MSDSVRNRCVHCASVADRKPGTVCDPCWAIWDEIIESNRRKFAKLITAGVSRRMANEIMIRRDTERPS